MDFNYLHSGNQDIFIDQICHEAISLAKEVRGIPKDPKSPGHRKWMEHFNHLCGRVAELSERAKQGDTLNPSSLKKLQGRLDRIDQQMKSQKIQYVIGRVALRQLTECQSKVKQLLSPENRLLWAKEAAERQKQRMEPKEIEAPPEGGQSGPKSWLLHGLLFLESMGWRPRTSPTSQNFGEANQNTPSTPLVKQTPEAPVPPAPTTPILSTSEIPTTEPKGWRDPFSIKGLGLVGWLEQYEGMKRMKGISEDQRQNYLGAIKANIQALAQVFQIGWGSLLNWLPGEPLVMPLFNRKRMELVKILVECGVSPNQKDESGTPLLHLVMGIADPEERRELVKALIAAGVTINARDTKGQTAAELLLKQQEHAPNRHDAKLLLSLYMAGAAVKAQHVVKIFNLALQVGDPDTLKELVKRVDHPLIDSLQKQGVSVAAEFVKQAEDERESLQRLIDRGLDVNQVDESGRSALYHACRLHKPRLARALWMQGATLSTEERSLLMKTKGDFIPLLASQFKSPYVAPKPSAPFRSVSTQHGDAIIEAARNHRFTELSRLLEQGVNTEHLQWALKEKNEHVALMIVSKLVEKGRDLDVPDNRGNTVVHTAVENGQVKVLEALLLAGADVDSENHKSLRPFALVYPYETGRKLTPEGIKCLQLLVEAGASSGFKEDPLGTFVTLYHPNIPLPDFFQGSLSYKTLGHAFEMNHRFEFRGSYIPLEGGFSSYFAKEMAEAFEELQATYPKLLSKEESEEIASILKRGNTEHTAQEYFEEAQHNVTLSIHTGFSGHAVEVSLYQNQYLIVSNKGRETEKAVAVYKIDPNKITEKTIQNIITKRVEPREAYVKWLHHLEDELGAKQDSLTEAVSSAYPLVPYQSVGNCAWESVETSVFALIAMKRLSQYDFSVTKPDSDAIASVQDTFVNWLKFTQLYVLDKHIALYEQDQVSQEDVPINHQILQTVFRKARLSPSTLPELDDHLNQLEERYLNLTRKSQAESETLNFKISRIWDKTLLQEPEAGDLGKLMMAFAVGAVGFSLYKALSA